MKRLIASCVAFALVVVSAAGAEPPQAFVEAFLETLPYRAVSWTTRDLYAREPYTGFSALRLTWADGESTFCLQHSRLVSVARHPEKGWLIDLTHHFVIFPGDVDPVRAVAADASDVPLCTVGGENPATKEQADELSRQIDSFAGLSARYSEAYMASLRSDPSGPLFGGVLYTAVTAGLVYYILVYEENGPWELAGKLGFVGITSGLLAAMGWGGYVTEKVEQRRLETRVDELALEMRQAISDLRSGWAR